MEQHMKPRISYLFIFVSSALAFGLASIFHFAYEWLGSNLFAGLFFPVNESVFQHLKLILYPLAIVWILLYRWVDIPERLNKFQIFTGILISTVITTYAILSIYYILEGGFLCRCDAVNIVSLFFCMLIGQFFSSRYLSRSHASEWGGICSIILLVATAVLLAYFTLYPLNIPIMTPPG